MWETGPAPDGPAPDLAVALLYAGGRLGQARAAAFEHRLGEDQAARDALAEAARLLHCSPGRPLLPRLAYRDRVRRRLSGRGRWGRVFGRRSVRGHFGLAAAVWAMGVLLGVLTMPPARPLPDVPPAVAADDGRPAPSPAAADPPGSSHASHGGAPGGPGLDGEAEAWGELSDGEHLARAHEEEARRRHHRHDDHQSGSHDLHDAQHGEEELQH